MQSIMLNGEMSCWARNIRPRDAWKYKRGRALRGTIRCTVHTYCTYCDSPFHISNPRIHCMVWHLMHATVKYDGLELDWTIHFRRFYVSNSPLHDLTLGWVGWHSHLNGPTSDTCLYWSVQCGIIWHWVVDWKLMRIMPWSVRCFSYDADPMLSQ